MNTGLGPAQRNAALERLAEEKFDVLVIGAGVTGAGSALDAVTRGLSTALVEGRDYASGTSSRSSKLLHGGLRYLEQLNFALVFEALKERKLGMNKLYPHLARPVQFIYPLRRRLLSRSYAGLGIGVYDVMGAGRGVPAHLKHLSRRKTLELFPSADPSAIVGSISFYEGQIDDARHTMTLARTAAHYGAAVASSLLVIDLLRDGDRVVGVLARDRETGAQLRIRARQVVNAAGVWTDQIQAMAGGRGSFRVRASKGVHLVVPRSRIDAASGLITRTEKSLLFIIPWGAHWLIGTTDTDWNLDLAHPAASRTDIDYLLDHANTLLADPLTEADVVGVYAGLRPLLGGESDSTSKLSREHAVASPVPGLVVVAGGKYTTYRVMAADAIDAVARSLPRTPASCTEDVPLLGAEGFRALWNNRAAIAGQLRTGSAMIDRMLGRYGSLITEVKALIDLDPELARPLAGAPEYLRAEIVYAASHEGALHLDDILTRRTRISIETWDRGIGAADEVAELVAPVLGWDEARLGRELEHYRLRVAAERDSQQHDEDSTADAARLGAPEIRDA